MKTKEKVRCGDERTDTGEQRFMSDTGEVIESPSEGKSITSKRSHCLCTVSICVCD